MGLLGDPIAGSCGLLGSGLLLTTPFGAADVREASADFLSWCILDVCNVCLCCCLFSDLSSVHQQESVCVGSLLGNQFQ